MMGGLTAGRLPNQAGSASGQPRTAALAPAALASIAVAALALPAGARAAAIRVNTTSDDFGSGASCSLREAIQAANSDSAFGGCPAGGGADTISLKGGARYIREQPGLDDANAMGDYDVSSAIAISVRGTGRAEINGGGLDRVIQVLPGGSLSASRVVIRDGDALDTGQGLEGGGILNKGSLALARSAIVHNEALGNQCSCGGGLAADGGTAFLDHVRVAANAADNLGGGIAFFGGTLTVKHSVIAANTADSSGGGIATDTNSTADPMLVSSSTVSGNRTLNATSANFGGGGISIQDFAGGTMRAVNVTIVGNTSAAEGGGAFAYAGDLSLNATTITGNVAEANGVDAGGGGSRAQACSRATRSSPGTRTRTRRPAPTASSPRAATTTMSSDSAPAAPREPATSPPLTPGSASSAPTAARPPRSRCSAARRPSARRAGPRRRGSTSAASGATGTPTAAPSSAASGRGGGG